MSSRPHRAASKWGTAVLEALRQHGSPLLTADLADMAGAGPTTINAALRALDGQVVIYYGPQNGRAIGLPEWGEAGVRAAVTLLASRNKFRTEVTAAAIRVGVEKESRSVPVERVRTPTGTVVKFGQGWAPQGRRDRSHYGLRGYQAATASIFL